MNTLGYSAGNQTNR